MPNKLPTLFSNFIHSSTLPMAISNFKLEILDINKTGAKILGYTADEIIGKSTSFFTLVGDISFDFESFQKLIANKIDSYSFKRRYKSADGSAKEGVLTVSLIGDNNQKYILGAFHSDGKVEETGKSSVSINTLSQILSVNPDIHYIYDEENDKFIYQNINVLEYLGYAEKEIGKNSIDSFLKSKIDKESIVVKKNNYNKKIQSFDELEYRIQTKDGDWKWFNSRQTVLENNNKDVRLKYFIISDITKEKLIRDEIEYQYNFIEQITTILPDVIYVYDPYTDDVIYTNLNGKSFLGYSEEDWLESGRVKPMGEYAQKLVDDGVKLLALADGAIMTEEYKYLDKSGRERWLMLKGKIFSRKADGSPEYCLLLAVDITESKNSAEMLRNSKKEVDSIVKAIPDLMLILDKDGNYLDFYAKQKTVERYKKDLLNKNVVDVIEEGVAKEILRLIKKCLKEDSLEQIDFKFKERDGSITYHTNHISKLDENRVLILARNVTDKKLMEIEISNRVYQLSDKNSELERFIEKNTELERFAYIISHDLKEPLRSISSISQIVKNEISTLNNAKLNMLVEHLIDASSRMNAMIEGVLDYSKLETNLVQNVAVNLNAVLGNIISDFARIMAERNIEIELEDLPIVKGNEVQIRQLFQNLINNAIKFNNSGSPKIKIYTEKQGKETVFCIADNGIGIEEKFRESIFKLFRKLNSDQKYSGQGIGLSICKKIVDNHDGKIWVEDNPEGGSIFKFTLFQ
ncbi:MAG: PAS domain S-box protein [Bacteroidetes bacterium]|nr:PAS domain S-box protein [Bacteroidota bacterium]